MSHDDDNADCDPLALLRALRSDTPAPAASARNVLDRLLISIPAGISALNATPGRHSSPVDGAYDDVASSHAALRAVPRLWSNGVVAIARPWAWAVGLTLAGGVGGGVLHAAFAPSTERVVYVDRPSSTESPARGEGSNGAIESTPSPERASAERPAHAPTTALPISPARPSPPETTASASTLADSALTKERAILDEARRALGAGNLDMCVTHLTKHARAFPGGKLAEEREALMVNALVGLGRYAEARQKAERFARRYPHSFLAPSVEAAIAAIP
jgi:hypothetical protein